MPSNFEYVVLWWGPGILILMAFGYGLLRVAQYWIAKSMQIKSQRIESVFNITRQYIEQFLSSQRSQSDALSRLAESVEHRDTKESFEHQEMLIAIKAMHRDVEALYHRQGTPAASIV